MEMTRPDEAELHAWVDGQLDAARAAEVARWLAAHPDEAARVAAWQAQRAGLQALELGVLDDPVPPRLLHALRPANDPWWRQALAAGVLLALGTLLGYGLGWRAADAQHGRELAARPPTFVREAAAAHVVYVPEQRHPVEVEAAQQEHLVQWLSKRLGAPLRVPRLEGEGLRLIGGRLLPGEAGQARAQFMYEGDAGARVTLYVSVLATPGATASAPAAFSWQADGSTHSFYWVDGHQGYALSAALPRPQLQAIAQAVYRQLQAEPGGPTVPSGLPARS